MITFEELNSDKPLDILILKEFVIKVVEDLQDRIEDLECEIKEFHQLRDHILVVQNIERETTNFKSNLVNEYCKSLDNKSGE